MYLYAHLQYLLKKAKIILQLYVFWSILRNSILGFMRFIRELAMKDLTLLAWLTQLGLSVALPLAGFILLALWLRDALSWGNWVLWVGIVLGFISAMDGLRLSLKALSQLTKNKKEDAPPPLSFNDHD